MPDVAWYIYWLSYACFRGNYLVGIDTMTLKLLRIVRNKFSYVFLHDVYVFQHR